MKNDRTPEWSERRQVLAIMAIAAAAILALAYFVLLPVNRSKKRIEDKIRDMSATLASQNYGGDEKTLAARLQSEQEVNVALRRQFAVLMERMAAFQDQQSIAKAGFSHIDFKVALLGSQRRLRQKSAAAGVSLTPDLGMDDRVDSAEDPRLLMLQVRAVEKAAGLVLGTHAKSVDIVRPLPPVLYRTGERNELYLEEYPVYVSFHGRTASVYELLDSILHEGNACAIRRLRIEKAAPGRQDFVKVDVVVSALVFPKKMDDLTWPSIKETAQLNPAGH